MSNSVQPDRRKPTRLPCSWDSPGKNTGLGYHFLLQCMKVKNENEDAPSCPTLCNPMDGSSPVPGILQARTLEWVAISFSSAGKWKVKGKTLSHVWLFATPWTAAYQAPLSMGFSRQEYWSGLPLPSRVTLLQSLITYRSIHLINCFKSSHHFSEKLSHMLGNTRNNNLVKQAKNKWYS